MKFAKAIELVILMGLLSTRYSVFAQANAGAQTNRAARDQTNTVPMQSMPEMEAMTKSVTIMADQCRAMMEKEMKAMPFKILAGSVLGSLLAIALILFIILEVQWIRWLSLRIATDGIRARSSPT